MSGPAEWSFEKPEVRSGSDVCFYGCYLNQKKNAPHNENALRTAGSLSNCKPLRKTASPLRTHLLSRADSRQNLPFQSLLRLRVLSVLFNPTRKCRSDIPNMLGAVAHSAWSP